MHGSSPAADLPVRCETQRHCCSLWSLRPLEGALWHGAHPAHAPGDRDLLRQCEAQRQDLLDGMRHEIQDEAEHQKESASNAFWSKEKH